MCLKNSSVSDKRRINTTWSASHHVEVGAPVTLNAATKASLRSKRKSEKLDSQAIFLKQKRRSETKNIRMDVIKLASVSSTATNFLEVGAASH